MRATRPARRSRRIVAVTGVAVVLSGLVAASPALGSSRDDVERRQGEVETEAEQSQAALEGIDAELIDAARQLEELEAQVPAAQAAVAAAEEAAQEARARDAELAIELDVTRAALDATAAELADREEEMAETQRDITSVVRETYRGSELNELAILVEASDPDEYADMLMLARSARQSQDRTMARLQVQAAEIRNVEDRQQAQEDELEELKVEAEETVVAAETAEAAAVAAEEELASLVASQEATVAEFEQARQAEEQRLDDLTSESAALESQLAAIAAEEQAAAEAAQRAAEPAPESGSGSGSGGGGTAAAAPAPSGGSLSMPVNGRITSSFGYRVHPILGYEKLHSGTDFGAPCGTPVRAAADGQVIQASWSGGYGNHIVVTHGLVNGVSLATSYSHLSSYERRSGSVSRGEVIGYVGTTGSSTGCHLHFETREAGVAVNPTTWL